MINRIIEFFAKVTLGKYLVQAVSFLHNKLDGQRSELILGVIAVTQLLKVIAIIPAETADSVAKILSPLLPLTLADKASKVFATIDKVVPALPTETK